jgi:hypothetical protein
MELSYLEFTYTTLYLQRWAFRIILVLWNFYIVPILKLFIQFPLFTQLNCFTSNTSLHIQIFYLQHIRNELQTRLLFPTYLRMFISWESFAGIDVLHRLDEAWPTMSNLIFPLVLIFNLFLFGWWFNIPFWYNLATLLYLFVGIVIGWILVEFPRFLVPESIEEFIKLQFIRLDNFLFVVS